MTDKPRTLSEQLTELAERVKALANARHDQGWMTWAEELADVADEVRDMAERAKECVLSPVTAFPPDELSDYRWEVRALGRFASGATKEEAVANPQSLLDELEGE